MKVGKYKGLLQSTALVSLSLLTAFPGFAQEAASIEEGITPAQDIRDYYGDNDPADAEFSPALVNSVSIGGMSADGSTFVGSVFRSYSKSIYSGFVWTADEGVQPVGERDPNAPLDGSQYYTATGISADGNVIVGKAAPGVSGGDFGQRAYRWTEAGGFEPLGSIEGNTNPFSEATAVSGDGQVVVGYVGATGGEAFRWTEDDGMQSLGWLEGRDSYGNDKALAASYDGSVIVGSALSDTDKFQAFHWTESTGMVALPTLSASSASQNTATATGISWDGTIIAGHSRQGYANQAVRWVNGEIFSLGGLDGASSVLSVANGISGNGQVIVGDVSSGPATGHGFRWTEGSGMLTVEDWLRASGATIVGSHPAEPDRSDITMTANATNEDGSVVVGLTRSGEVYIARGNGTGPTGGGVTDPDPVDPDPVDPDPVDPDPVDPDPVDPDPVDPDPVDPDPVDPDPVDPDPTDPDPNDPGAGLITIGNLASSLAGTGAANTSLVNSLGVIVNGAGSRPLDRRAPEGRFTGWLGGDWGRDDHGSRDGTLGLGEIGLGYNFGPVQLNGVAGYTGLDQNTLLGGTTDVRAGYVKLEAMGQITGDETGGLWGIVTGTGLWGNADITRNYVINGGLVDSSIGRTDVEGYGIRGRLQWENAIPHISPYGELSYAHTCLGAYTETGGAFPAAFNELCDGSTEVRYGFDAKFPVTEQFRLIGTLEGVHRFEDSGSNVTGQVVGLGGFNLGAANYQQDWLRAGAGFEVDISGSTLSVMGNATTKGESSNAWVAANWRITF